VRSSPRAPEGIAALDVAVDLDRGARRLQPLRDALYPAMVNRYRRSSNVSFGQIRFIIDRVETDPVARRDLLLYGRLVVSTRSGTEIRRIERRIHGGAASRSSDWIEHLIPSLLNAMDYQLRLLQT
jgi:hypothetical protein